jgi:hypothetical protein
MTRLVKANTATAAHRRCYFLVVGTDGITPATGEAGGQPEMSTNGGAWTSAGGVIGTLSHIGNGRYYADLSQAAVATAGDVIETRHKSATTAEIPGDTFQVVAFDPNDATALGLSNLNATVASRSSHTAADVWLLSSAHAAFSTAGSIGKFIADSLNLAETVMDAISAGVASLLGRLTSLRAGYLDNLSSGPVALAASLTAAYDSLVTTIGTRLAAEDYIAPDNATITAIETAVAALPDADAIATAVDTLLTDEHGDGAWADSGAAPSASDVAAAVLEAIVEGSYTLAHMIRGMASALMGKSSGGGTNTKRFRDMADTTDRITATTDGHNNRTAVDLDLD